MVNHSDLIRTLLEFYTLLAQLTFIEPSGILTPNPIHDVDVATLTAKALEAGYLHDMVDLVLHLPQLDASICNDGTHILPSTYMRNFLHDDDWDREIWERPDWEEEERYWPANMLCLTRSNIYGYLLVYDIDTGLMRAWDPFADPEDDDHWRRITPKLPSEVFAAWIKHYRSLEYLVLPSHIDWDYEGNLYDRNPPDGREGADKELWNAGREVWKAERKVRDIYLDCGWNVNASGEQTGFRRGEFLEKRKAYWDSFVAPLEEHHMRIWESIMSSGSTMEDETRSQDHVADEL